ncbi:unnamed protein product [Larinioides sclopetarius]|uniref:Uncharacterized protein n=1 Tax=Larinioides sclopetarius TaxID=280406 RepID=A0AAV1ZUK2_9ARAC
MEENNWRCPRCFKHVESSVAKCSCTLNMASQQHEYKGVDRYEFHQTEYRFRQQEQNCQNNFFRIDDNVSIRQNNTTDIESSPNNANEIMLGFPRERNYEADRDYFRHMFHKSGERNIPFCMKDLLFQNKTYRGTASENKCRQNFSSYTTASKEILTLTTPVSNLNKNKKQDHLECPPKHPWYQCSQPGGSLAQGFNRQEQTILARFRSGHLKSMKFSEGSKNFKICTNCSSEQASPYHVLECLGLTKQDLADDPLMVLDYLRVPIHVYDEYEEKSMKD